MVKIATALLLHLLTARVDSETIDVRDRGTVNLAGFECRDINRSSIIQRVCYDRSQNYLIVGIHNVFDQFCDLPPSTFDSLMAAPSMGQFFMRNISGSGRDSRYDCATGSALRS